jgi:LmbE family N-acetylglucosaminyl deacetylase
MFPLAPPRDGRAPLRVQVVVAHPDDETFGCGSLLLHAAAAGAVTGVACATRGEAGEAAEGVDVPPDGLAAVREAELHEAAELMGVSDVRLLGFLDSDMGGDPAPGTLCGAPFDDVVTAVQEAVDRFGADVLVTLDGTDHRDHARIRDAATVVARSRGLPLFVQAIPRSLLQRWVDHQRQANPASVYLDIVDIGTPDDELTHVFDTAEHYDARWTAMRAHRSQTGPFAGLPDDLARAFLTREYLVEVPVADRAS